SAQTDTDDGPESCRSAPNRTGFARQAPSQSARRLVPVLRLANSRESDEPGSSLLDIRASEFPGKACASCALLVPTAREDSCDRDPTCSIGRHASHIPALAHADTCGRSCDPDPVAPRSGTGSDPADATAECSSNPPGEPSATPGRW